MIQSDAAQENGRRVSVFLSENVLWLQQNPVRGLNTNELVWGKDGTYEMICMGIFQKMYLTHPHTHFSNTLQSTHFLSQFSSLYLLTYFLTHIIFSKSL